MSVQARVICSPDRVSCRSAPIPGARVTSAAVPVLADRRRSRRVTAACSAVSAVTVAEEEANQKRWEESGKQSNVDQWRWTLNWNTINDNIVVGSCPRSTQDIVTLRREAGIDAILNLQSDGCFDALKIDYKKLRAQATCVGVTTTRVAIWDFNHNDQALMLPEAVRKLALLVAMGKRVYVHCTAGINRATLTVVGYLTFVQGWSLHEAETFVKSQRPQAHPYIDCWKTTRARLVEGRTEEILNTAANLYEERKRNGSHSDSSDSLADWVNAEAMLIKEQFQRQIQADLSLMVSLNDLEEARHAEAVCMTPDEFADIQAEMGLLRDKAEKERAHARAALAQAARQADENQRLREMKPHVVAMLESRDQRAKRLKAAEKEIGALKDAIREVAMSALRATAEGTEALVGTASAKVEAGNGASASRNGKPSANGNGNGYGGTPDNSDTE
eukprot:jgi/Ulvmu1/10300/UM060_0102.1